MKFLEVFGESQGNVDATLSYSKRLKLAEDKGNPTWKFKWIYFVRIQWIKNISKQWSQTMWTKELRIQWDD